MFNSLSRLKEGSKHLLSPRFLVMLRKAAQHCKFLQICLPVGCHAPEDAYMRWLRPSAVCRLAILIATKMQAAIGSTTVATGTGQPITVQLEGLGSPANQP